MLSSKIANSLNNQVEKFSKFPGGAPANVATAVALLGGDSYFAGKLSTDIFGRFLKRSLIEMGVKTDYASYTDMHKTALAFVSRNEVGDRSFEFYRNDTADLNFATQDFSSEWFSTKGIFHACSNTLTTERIFKATIHGLELAKKNDWLVSFDVNLRKKLWQNSEDSFSRIWRCLELANIIKFSKEELEFVADGGNEDEIINRLLRRDCNLIVVTDGPNPLRCFLKSGDVTMWPPKMNVKDTTAAGDAFVGGILYSLANAEYNRRNIKNLSHETKELQDILSFAIKCGAFAVTRDGAFTSLPTQEDLDKFEWD